MSINNIPCGKCDHFDPALGPHRKKTNYGWCAKKSRYAYSEGPGQVVPPGVHRVGLGEIARPYLVKWEELEAACTDAKLTNRDHCEDKRRAERGNRLDPKTGLPILE